MTMPWYIAVPAKFLVQCGHKILSFLSRLTLEIVAKTKTKNIDKNNGTAVKAFEVFPENLDALYL